MLTAVVLSLYGCKSADREKAEADTVKTEESTVPESDTAENVGQDTDGNGADRASAKSSTSANDSPSEESLGKNGDPISGGSDEKGTLSDSDTNGSQQTDKTKNFAAGAADALGKVQEPLTVKEEDDMAPVFTSEEIPDEVFARMAGKSYKEDCTVPREDLRYLRISCVGADGSAYIGEMVAAADLAEDLLDIFRQLYEAGYPIERMQLIDDYDASDQASMEANNTTCFNFRQIAGSTKLSNHSLGRAVDINPLYNPYVKKTANGTIYDPPVAEAYADRDKDFPYKIDHDDLCYQLFTAHGFTWGGDWNRVKDYQHFEK